MARICISIRLAAVEWRLFVGPVDSQTPERSSQSWKWWTRPIDRRSIHPFKLAPQARWKRCARAGRSRARTDSFPEADRKTPPKNLSRASSGTQFSIFPISNYRSAIPQKASLRIGAYSFWEIDELTAANGQLNFLDSNFEWTPLGVAVDGAGNVYFSNYGDGAVEQWAAASGMANNLRSPGKYQPYGVAVDRTGDVFMADTENNAIEEMPRAFIDPTAKMEPMAAGTDVLPMALPATQSLAGPFAPVSDQAWLTVTGVTNGVVSFAFTANPNVSRTAHITMLGATSLLRKAAPSPLLSGATPFQN